MKLSAILVSAMIFHPVVVESANRSLSRHRLLGKSKKDGSSLESESSKASKASPVAADTASHGDHSAYYLFISGKASKATLEHMSKSAKSSKSAKASRPPVDSISYSISISLSYSASYSMSHSMPNAPSSNATDDSDPRIIELNEIGGPEEYVTNELTANSGGMLGDRVVVWVKAVACMCYLMMK